MSADTLVPLQSNPTTEDPVLLAAWLLGVGFAAAVAAGLVAVVYRWYVRERVPTGLGVLFGLTVVSVYVGATGALGAVISDPQAEEAILQTSDVLPNLGAFALGAAGSSVGIRVGDAVGTDLFAATGGRTVDADVSEIVQTVGRVTSVKLPDDIDDIVGYDPMPEETKQSLAGKRFLFPRRLTKAELRDRLVSRLKTDYGVGHVDLELDDDGTVDYIAVGSRAAGIGPTLPPATNAVAVRADPANAASSGDLVQVWDTDPHERVLTGELRGVAGDVVTIAIDAADTPKLDPTREYKLVTLPVQDRPDREFASLLRAADETMGTITVPAGSELAGTPIGELGVTVAAITQPDSPPEPIPSRERVLDDGDVIYAIATPEALRRVETAANRQRPAAVPEDTEEGDGIEDDAGDGDGVEDGGADDASETADEPAADGDLLGEGDDEPTGDESASGTDDEPTGDGSASGTDGENTGATDEGPRN
ncbi:TrkA C-terminal domain-containing protein [Halomicroarcula sp. F28]|uniref:TrkA C-terminal domain-containing protein n=1 Tax=Haloarcula salinisoli TaxID=2487746 RepID=UPI001C731B8B|nr:TrkA C-terminal domain-containing protein [Halomicroarcula salinisoli]